MADGEGSFPIIADDTPAELRVIHASPDAPPVDVVVNDDFMNPVLTDVPFGAVSEYLAAPAIEPFVPVEANRRIATEAKVRIVHLAPTAELVDIYVTAPDAGIEGAEPAFSDIDFGDETDFVSLVGGSYDVTVTAAGTSTPVIGPVTATVAEGGVYTTAARDAEGSGPPSGFTDGRLRRRLSAEHAAERK